MLFSNRVVASSFSPPRSLPCRLMGLVRAQGARTRRCRSFPGRHAAVRGLAAGGADPRPDLAAACQMVRFKLGCARTTTACRRCAPGRNDISRTGSTRSTTCSAVRIFFMPTRSSRPAKKLPVERPGADTLCAPTHRAHPQRTAEDSASRSPPSLRLELLHHAARCAKQLHRRRPRRAAFCRSSTSTSRAPGKTIREVESWSISTREGNPASDGMRRRTPRAWFRASRSCSPTGSGPPQTLYYFRTDVSNGGVNNSGAS